MFNYSFLKKERIEGKFRLQGGGVREEGRKEGRKEIGPSLIIYFEAKGKYRNNLNHTILFNLHV